MCHNKVQNRLLAWRNSGIEDMLGSYYGSLTYDYPREKQQVTKRYEEEYMNGTVEQSRG